MSLDEPPIFRRYVQKPFEACKLTAENIQAVAEWCGGEIYDKRNDPDEPISIDVGTKTITADIGDYVVRSSAGSFYKVDPDSFEALYEPVWW